ncbi:MAG: CpaF family protein [Eubacteriales bacterium]|nr:CpaF family protein [Eubacteriales bacterium]
MKSYHNDSRLNELYKEIREELLSEFSQKGYLNNSELYNYIDGKIQRIESLNEKIYLRNRLFNSFRKLDILQELLDDDEIQEIMVNGCDNIFIEKNGQIIKYDICFDDNEKLEDIIQQIVSRINRRVNTASPIVDARLEDGSRVHVVLPPIALNGPVLTIRKFPEPIDMEKLIRYESITEEAASFMKLLVETGYNIFISGGTGSGKSTFLNALSEFIPSDERVITIEDSAELRIRHIPNLVRLETRNSNAGGEGEISMAMLIKACLRMRPDRIVVGEVRGKECMDMLTAMNTGHDGSLSTGHANSVEDMLSRLETMVLMGAELPLIAIREQIASAIDIMVHLERMPDKSRKVMEIAEVKSCENGKIQLHSLFKYDTKEKRLKKTGELTRREKLSFKYAEMV